METEYIKLWTGAKLKLNRFNWTETRKLDVIVDKIYWN